MGYGDVNNIMNMLVININLSTYYIGNLIAALAGVARSKDLVLLICLFAIILLIIIVIY